MHLSYPTGSMVVTTAAGRLRSKSEQGIESNRTPCVGLTRVTVLDWLLASDLAIRYHTPNMAAIELEAT